MDEEINNEFIEYLNDLDKKADTLEPVVHLYAIEEARLNNVDIPLDNIYNCVRKDYNERIGKDTDDKTILYKYLKEKERYNLLNVLIALTIKNMLEEGHYKDLFVLNNFELFSSIIMLKSLNLMSTGKLEDIEFTKITDEEINSIIEEFLIKIDPTLEWLGIYRNVKVNGTIIEIDKLSNSEKERYKKRFGKLENCCVLDDETPYILLENSNTLKYIRSFFHEFAHYIIMLHRKIAYPAPFFSEYPSIFYEMYLTKYLSDKKFNKEEIDYLIKYRDIRTLDNSFDIGNILGYIKKILSGKKIKEEEEILNYTTRINNLPTELIEVINQNLTNINIMDATAIMHHKCDSTCDMLIKYPYDFNDVYSYITGNYLADKRLEKVTDDESFLVKMKYITENIGAIEPSNIFNELGLDIDKIKEEAKEYCKVKKS